MSDHSRGAGGTGLRLLTVFTLILGAACAELGSPVEPPSQVERVMVAPGVTFVMPTPAELGQRVEVAQLVTAHYGSDDFVFEGRLSVSPERLRLVGTDPMGRRILTIQWASGRLTIDKAHWLPEAVRPQNILADIVLLFWPEAVVRRGLADSGATLVADGRTRSVRKDGRELIVIGYDGAPWSDVVRLDNQGWGYRLEVRTVGAEP